MREFRYEYLPVVERHATVRWTGCEVGNRASVNVVLAVTSGAPYTGSHGPGETCSRVDTRIFEALDGILMIT